MANYTQTISMNLRVHGGSPTNKWGSMVWGSDLWGASEDLVTTVYKGISNSISTDNNISKSFTKVLVNNISITVDMLSEQLQDGSGYNYVLIGGTIEGESRNLISYTEDGSPDLTYTVDGDPSTEWG